MQSLYLFDKDDIYREYLVFFLCYIWIYAVISSSGGSWTISPRASPILIRWPAVNLNSKLEGASKTSTTVDPR